MEEMLDRTEKKICEKLDLLATSVLYNFLTRTNIRLCNKNSNDISMSAAKPRHKFYYNRRRERSLNHAVLDTLFENKNRMGIYRALLITGFA